MKLPALIKTTGLALSLVVGAYLLHPEPSVQNASCIKLMMISEQGIESAQLQCSPAPQQSWLAWFSGQSRSTQFHFIDLLELLNRFKH
jgi:hypothetical protein